MNYTNESTERMASYLRFPQRDGLYRIFPDRVAVYDRYRDRVVMLDELGSEIWLRADGKSTLHDIAVDIAVLSNRSTDLMLRLIDSMVVILMSEGLMFLNDTAAELPYHLSFAQEDQDLNLMRDSMQNAGWLDE